MANGNNNQQQAQDSAKSLSISQLTASQKAQLRQFPPAQRQEILARAARSASQPAGAPQQFQQPGQPAAKPTTRMVSGEEAFELRFQQEKERLRQEAEREREQGQKASADLEGRAKELEEKAKKVFPKFNPGASGRITRDPRFQEARKLFNEATKLKAKAKDLRRNIPTGSDVERNIERAKEDLAIKFGQRGILRNIEMKNIREAQEKFQKDVKRDLPLIEKALGRELTQAERSNPTLALERLQKGMESLGGKFPIEILEERKSKMDDAVKFDSGGAAVTESIIDSKISTQDAVPDTSGLNRLDVPTPRSKFDVVSDFFKKVPGAVEETVSAIPGIELDLRTPADISRQARREADERGGVFKESPTEREFRERTEEFGFTTLDLIRGVKEVPEEPGKVVQTEFGVGVKRGEKTFIPVETSPGKTELVEFEVRTQTGVPKDQAKELVMFGAPFRETRTVTTEELGGPRGTVGLEQDIISLQSGIRDVEEKIAKAPRPGGGEIRDVQPRFGGEVIEATGEFFRPSNVIGETGRFATGIVIRPKETIKATKEGVGQAFDPEATAGERTTGILTLGTLAFGGIGITRAAGKAGRAASLQTRAATGSRGAAVTKELAKIAEDSPTGQATFIVEGGNFKKIDETTLSGRMMADTVTVTRTGDVFVTKATSEPVFRAGRTQDEIQAIIKTDTKRGFISKDLVPKQKGFLSRQVGIFEVKGAVDPATGFGIQVVEGTVQRPFRRAKEVAPFGIVTRPGITGPSFRGDGSVFIPAATAGGKGRTIPRTQSITEFDLASEAKLPLAKDVEVQFGKGEATQTGEIVKITELPPTGGAIGRAETPIGRFDIKSEGLAVGTPKGVKSQVLVEQVQKIDGLVTRKAERAIMDAEAGLPQPIPGAKKKPQIVEDIFIEEGKAPQSSFEVIERPPERIQVKGTLAELSGRKRGAEIGFVAEAKSFPQRIRKVEIVKPGEAAEKFIGIRGREEGLRELETTKLTKGKGFSETIIRQLDEDTGLPPGSSFQPNILDRRFDIVQPDKIKVADRKAPSRSIQDIFKKKPTKKDERPPGLSPEELAASDNALRESFGKFDRTPEKDLPVTKEGMLAALEERRAPTRFAEDIEASSKASFEVATKRGAREAAESALRKRATGAKESVTQAISQFPVPTREASISAVPVQPLREDTSDAFRISDRIFIRQTPIQTGRSNIGVSSAGAIGTLNLPRMIPAFQERISPRDRQRDFISPVAIDRELQRDVGIQTPLQGPRDIGVERQGERLAERQIERQLERQVQRQKTTQRTVAQRQFVTTPRGPLTRTPRTPRTPIIPTLPDSKLKQGLKIAKGFDVFVRREGEFIKITDKPLTEEQAKRFGAIQVGKTAARTFQVRPSAGEPIRTRFRPIDMGRFRQPKSKEDFFTLVQKKEFAIKSPGEKAEISDIGRQVISEEGLGVFGGRPKGKKRSKKRKENDMGIRPVGIRI